ncbi:MAG: helix-turn-helix transcriptional regulator [Ruminococcaceae bacterium]|nr:helix-turn-helix transcriptional regulator [Oscillospiraceae bacterium]
MIKYDKLWVTLESKGITKYKLTKEHGVSKSQIYRLQHNQSVNTNTLDRICNILECDIEDIMEHVQDDNRFRL